jgi:hypothetical protein
MYFGQYRRQIKSHEMKMGHALILMLRRWLVTPYKNENRSGIAFSKRRHWLF